MLKDLSRRRSTTEKANETLRGRHDGHALISTGELFRDLGDADRARQVWSRGVRILTERLKSYPKLPQASGAHPASRVFSEDKEALRRELAMLPETTRVTAPT